MNSYEKAGNYLEVAKLASKCLTSASKKMLEDARDEKEKVKIISQYASEHIDIGKSLTNVAHKIETNDAKKAEHFIVAGHSHLKAAKVFSGIKDHKNAAENYDAAADAYKQGGENKV